MTVEEILRGESKDLEFKEKLPEDRKKYMKTIVAFSNGDGGRLIIGVNDDTEVVGVEQTAVFMNCHRKVYENLSSMLL